VEGLRSRQRCQSPAHNPVRMNWEAFLQQLYHFTFAPGRAGRPWRYCSFISRQWQEPPYAAGAALKGKKAVKYCLASSGPLEVWESFVISHTTARLQPQSMLVPGSASITIRLQEYPPLRSAISSLRHGRKSVKTFLYPPLLAWGPSGPRGMGVNMAVIIFQPAFPTTAPHPPGLPHVVRMITISFLPDPQRLNLQHIAVSPSPGTASGTQKVLKEWLTNLTRNHEVTEYLSTASGQKSLEAQPDGEYCNTKYPQTVSALGDKRASRTDVALGGVQKRQAETLVKVLESCHRGSASFHSFIH
uniref:Angiopoietin like 6 n=1 Tax=Sus scrofa TaxID=9823 RepID=A0A8D1VHQ9_PIG